jgi:hypothetical protein
MVEVYTVKCTENVGKPRRMQTLYHKVIFQSVISLTLYFRIFKCKPDAMVNISNVFSWVCIYFGVMLKL